MYLIAGLGNPGKQYERTRHNMGFDTVDELVDRHRIPGSGIQHKAMYGKGMIAGEKVILAKPLTYMNLSGDSVREFINYYKIDPETELIVIYDDIDLEPGQIRIRKKGSAGGHNGKALSHSSAPRIFTVSRWVWAQNRQAGIWLIMCWAAFPPRRGRKWIKPSGRLRMQWK